MGESSSRFPTKPADSRTRFARRSDVRAVRRRPASERAGEPSRRDKYDGSDPPEGGGDGTPGGTPGGTPPPRLTAPAVKKGGSLPSFPSPLARFGSVGLGPKTRTTPAWCAVRWWYTPPLCFWYTPPHVRVPFRLPCALPCALPRNGPADGPLPFDPTPSPPRAD